MSIGILKTSEKFRVLSTHFRRSNPNTSFLKLKLRKKKILKGLCNSRRYVPERNIIALRFLSETKPLLKENI